MEIFAEKNSPLKKESIGEIALAAPESIFMRNFLKSRTIQAALISLVTTGLIIYFQQPATKQTHYGSGDNIIQNQQIYR